MTSTCKYSKTFYETIREAKGYPKIEHPYASNLAKYNDVGIYSDALLLWKAG